MKLSDQLELHLERAGRDNPGALELVEDVAELEYLAEVLARQLATALADADTWRARYSKALERRAGVELPQGPAPIVSPALRRAEAACNMREGAELHRRAGLWPEVVK